MFKDSAILFIFCLLVVVGSSSTKATSYIVKELIEDCETFDPILIHLGKLNLKIPAEYSPVINSSVQKLRGASSGEFGESRGIYCQDEAKAINADLISWHAWTTKFISHEFEKTLETNLWSIFFVSFDSLNYLESTPPNPDDYEKKIQVAGYWFFKEPNAVTKPRSNWFRMLEIDPPKGREPIWGACTHIKRSRAFTCTLRVSNSRYSFQSVGNYFYRYEQKPPETASELVSVFSPHLWREGLSNVNEFILKQSSKSND